MPIRKPQRAGLLLLSLLTGLSLAYAKTDVVLGEVWPVAEMDLLDWIQLRLSAKQQDGTLAALQRRFRDRVAQQADRPRPVQNITKATVSREWEIDPAIHVSSALRDTAGNIVVPAGTRVNPLAFVMLHSQLVFLDGDDAGQVAWADRFQQQQHNKMKIKWVLVRGGVSGLVRHFYQPVYFDQAGRLTARFHIQHVPAIVRQAGLHLSVSEVAI